jgi:Ser/Thr protein kinase RdoA (MazF antagonist)
VIDVATMGEEPLAFLLDGGFVADGVVRSYADAAEAVLVAAREAFSHCQPLRHVRLHGDCHMGNILWSDEGPCFVDLDDARNGPAIQDLWMLLHGSRDEMHGQILDVLEGYTTFFEFDSRETRLLEALRGLRFIYYSGWLARRWSDPAFPRAFPWFGSENYWREQIHNLGEQVQRIADRPLAVD